MRDESCWDGMWDWHTNTYSDGPQIITLIELLPRGSSYYIWPHNGHLCGDGPIQEFPLGTICHIAPVEDGYKNYPLIKAHLPECLWPEIARQHPGTLWHDGQPIENA